MSVLNPFLLAESPLENGVTLIEASAGTGKTFTIAGIVLRLVIEQRMKIGEILTVTFTEAATEELRDRVRRRLREALDDLRRGESGDEIVGKFFKNGDVRRGILDLTLAIESFDEARIFTIHGFCHRVLSEHAFESGAMFDAELVTDSEPLFEEVSRDFWRLRFYEAPPLLARLAITRKITPDGWIKLLNRIRNHPDICIVPDAGDEDCDLLAALLDKSFSKVIAAWKSSGDEVRTILGDKKNLSQSQGNFHPQNVEQIVRWFAQLSQNIGDAPPDALDAIRRLSISGMVAGTKPTGATPQHRFFDLCEDFCVLASRYFERLTHEFIAYARAEMPLRKERRNVFGYDDLLTRLRDALAGKNGDALAEALGGECRAALIDEFQDTDPVQYEIFRRVFGGGAHRLFFIGDPKQAIYGFRGADVFTYLRAVGETSRRYTLRTNWRSEQKLLEGINALFSREHPFCMEQIEYREVHAPAKPRKDFKVLHDPGAPPPLQFCFLKNDSGKSAMNQGDAESLVFGAVVADIARLHASGARLGDAPLRFGDMAVLVRSNRQAAQMQQRLRDAGIKSVLRSDASVFHTDEAEELQRLIDGVAECARDDRLRTALSTSLIVESAEKIATLDADETRWQQWLEKFSAWRERWARDGFIAMFRRLLVEQRVRERLVRHPGGERRLTNFLHLAELLHGAEEELRLVPDALCDWLRTRRNDARTAADEHQLRLESDGDAVQITTIHKSKGLEYPIVFCPFLWKPADSRKRTEVLFHDPKNERRLTLDLRARKETPEHDELAAAESLAESMRLLYVAVTRAQNRCHIYAGEISGIEKSPLGHALAINSPEGARPALQALAEKCDAAAVIDIEPDADVPSAFENQDGFDPASLAARKFRGTISQTAMVASFTALTSDRAEENPDRDADATLHEAELEPDPLAMFAPGARTGLFFHDVLELLDFQNPESIDTLVARQLAAHGIQANGAREAAVAQLRRVVDTELAPGLALNRIAMRDRLSEVEFAYPLPHMKAHVPSSPWLRDLFAAHGGPEMPAEIPASLGRLRFHPVEGYMRGFIDLVFRSGGKFWLIDWKTNALESYDDAGMCAGMTHHCYHLQYHLYVVALDLFFKSRVPGYDYDRHFGGVRYIFLRGVDPNKPQRGIFCDRPSAALVGALREAMTGRQS